jgi:hypothetical protein
MFNYMNHNQVYPRWHVIYRTVRAELELQGQALIGPNHDLHLRLDEFFDNIYPQMADRARRWGREVVDRVRAHQGSFGNLNNFTPQDVQDLITYWWIQFYNWYFPARYPGPFP